MPSLARPAPERFAAFVAMAEDYRRAGESRYQAADGWTFEKYQEYLRELADYADGVRLPPKKSRQITWWLVDEDGRILGVSRFRPELSDELREEGGNIGYDVPPSQRRRGHGTELLHRMLGKAREHGLERVLITCNEDNTASRKIIEANGGVLAGEGTSKKSGKPILRFWIECTGGRGDAGGGAP